MIIKDFKSISLVGSIYKLIAKVLTKRSSRVTGLVVKFSMLLLLLMRWHTLLLHIGKFYASQILIKPVPIFLGLSYYICLEECDFL